MRFCTVLAVVAVLISISSAAEDSDEPPDYRLNRLTEQAIAWHPRVTAARAEVKAFLAQHRELRGFFDPVLYAATGGAHEPRRLPGATSAPAGIDDTATVEGGIERAFSPGFYGSLGAAYHYGWDALNGEEDVTWNVVGAQLRIPLLRDRGFREYDLARQRTMTEFLAANSRLLAAVQAIRYEVALAYIQLQETHALLTAASHARERVAMLLNEAQELVRLKVVPEYQLHQAKLEVALRTEEEVAAREAFDLARLQLAQLLGEPAPATLALPPVELVSWARGVTVDLDQPFEQILRRRGTWLNRFHQRQGEATDLRLAREQLKGDLSLRAAVTWQGDSSDRGFTDDRVITDDHVGGTVQLVYSRPLFQTGAKENLQQEQAELEAASDRLQDEEITLKTGILEARRSYQTVRQRLDLANEAVTLARQTLTAEGERFRLGEGLSRDVLAAQQDLTNTIRLQSRNAARLLRARETFRFWTGYLPSHLFNQTDPPAEEIRHE